MEAKLKTELKRAERFMATTEQSLERPSFSQLATKKVKKKRFKTQRVSQDLLKVEVVQPDEK